MQAFDFIVIGSGAAGLTFAIKAAESGGSVAIITKRNAAESNTKYAQGGIASVTSVEDSFDLHIRDTLDAGAGLCDEEAVRTVVSEGPERIAELIGWGAKFDQRRNPDFVGQLDLTKEGGHSKRRILHAQDTTGAEVERTLLDKLAAQERITVLAHHVAIDLITTAKLGYTTEDRVLGLYALGPDGQVVTLRSDRVVLASGGCGKVYLYTTNPDIATGDGVAMAWRAGASVANMEFIQFHPTCLYHPQAKSFLISEAVRGEGGILRDSKGRAFMEKYDAARKDLAPRDIVARAIDAEMKRTGERCAYLDITHRDADFIIGHFPNIYQTCLTFGIDITKEPIPVVPAAHYQCGGVYTNINGATSIGGLYAIGEVGCTGLHGANRLASNSLLEALVTAHRACQSLLRELPLHANGRANGRSSDLPEWQSGDAQDLDEMVVIYHNWDEVRRAMWDYVGIVRTDKRLHRASTRLRNLQREIQEFYWNFKVNADLLELRNLVTVASLIVDCALSRKESRGLHYTLDHPDTDPRYLRPTILRRGDLYLSG